MSGTAGATTSATATVSSFDDRYDFRSFAQRLSTAVGQADLQFFIDNVTFAPLTCTLGEMPPPPHSCKSQPTGATVPGMIVGVWQSEGFSLGAAEYPQFISEFLTNPSGEPSDNYGDSKAKLYAYGIFRPQFQLGNNTGQPAGVKAVEAITTSIVAGISPRAFFPPGRGVLIFHVTFDGERWSITGLGVPAGATAALLDPKSQAGMEEAANNILEFWSRWE